ncbi:MAG: hypothetical protein ACRCXX_13705 [Cetobacterium sp.]|uniref:hypothetical protein n=1 Tax=Cetobacterium sp. TaxID=2071632 RepID=UPI003F2EECBF
MNVILIHKNHTVNAYKAEEVNFNPYYNSLTITMDKEYMRKTHQYVDENNNKTQDLHLDTTRYRSIILDGQELLVHSFLDRVMLRIKFIIGRDFFRI